VISRFDAASTGGAPCRNRIPALKKESQRNSIPAQKKQLGFYNACSFKIDIAFGTGDRFPQRKNSPNTAHAWTLARWRNRGGNRGQDGSSVTTNHLFWPNQRRRAASLLPIWIRNSDVSRPRVRPESREGGGGGPARRIQQEASIHKLARNFMRNRSPTPLALLSKKTSVANAAQCRADGAAALP
jgi:hypothetical protein